MKNFTPHKPLLLTLLALHLSCTTISAQTPAGPPLLSARWQPGSVVTIRYSAGGFGAEQRKAIRHALEDWNGLTERAGSSVTLRDGGVSEEPAPDCDFCITVIRDATLPSARVGQIKSTRGAGGYLTAAVIAMRPEVRDPKKVRTIMAHELGHAFGLADCPACAPGMSVMNYLVSIRVSGFSLSRWFKRAADAPTPADADAVRRGYETMAPAPEGASLVQGHADALTYSEIPLSARALDTSAPEQGVGRDPEAGEQSQPDSSAGTPERIASSEAEMVAALQNYTFTQRVLIETLDGKGHVTGEYRRISRMVLDDAGRRIEQILSFPEPTLKRLVITAEDLEDLSGAQFLGVDTSQISNYLFKDLGQESWRGRLYRLVRIRPRDLAGAKREGRRVFYGTALVEPETGRIALLRGKALPEGNQRFPLFETVRAEVGGGKLLFPSVSQADDLLRFPKVSIRMRMRVEYTDFKRFRVESRVLDDEDEISANRL